MRTRIYFRPSSHSDDGTVVATFKNAAEAKKVAEQINSFHKKNRVILIFNNEPEGTIDHYTKRLKQLGATKAEYYMCYEKLIVHVTLPIGVNEETIPLVVNTETSVILKELRRLCPKPQIKKTKNQQWVTLEFRYEGEGLLAACGTVLSFDNPLGRYNKEVAIPANVKVTVLTAL